MIGSLDAEAFGVVQAVHFTGLGAGYRNRNLFVFLGLQNLAISINGRLDDLPFLVLAGVDQLAAPIFGGDQNLAKFVNCGFYNLAVLNHGRLNEDFLPHFRFYQNAFIGRGALPDFLAYLGADKNLFVDRVFFQNSFRARNFRLRLPLVETDEAEGHDFLFRHAPRRARRQHLLGNQAHAESRGLALLFLVGFQVVDYMFNVAPRIKQCVGIALNVGFQALVRTDILRDCREYLADARGRCADGYAANT